MKKLIAILKTGKMDVDYLEAVRDKVVGSIVKQGYRIKEVIGVGNLGTTVQAYDIQRKENIVLKIYH